MSRVIDGEGKIREGDGARKVWKAHFEQLLNEGAGDVGGQRETVVDDDIRNEQLDNEITDEEVAAAMGKIKRKAAPGKDGLTAEMVDRDMLRNLWGALFNACWRTGVVPKAWKESMVVPVPKKPRTGPCIPDDFRGIALTSVVYKAMCTVIKERVVKGAEEKGLMSEEQCGFRKGRGCRDQLLTLMLLGKMKMTAKKRGMFGAFIDLKKAYDTIDQAKLWTHLQSMGLGGRLITFMKAAYKDVKCEVRVGGAMSEAFEVRAGLRQGCVLSPILFSLYIDEITTRLRQRGMGVTCGNRLIPALLYADDMVLLAEDEKGMEESLKVLQEWCVDWSLRVNGNKCGVIHFRRKGEERSKASFNVGQEAIRMVQEYKYLGCVVDEYLEYKSMIEARAKAGMKALYAWLQRCRACVGELRRGTFGKLLEMLVESVVMYGAEVWGCCRQLGEVEQVQLRAMRIFLGVGRLHPTVSLLVEMGVLPLEWVAKLKCVEFWYRVRKLGDERLVKHVAVEAWKQREMKWMKDLRQSIREMGWGEVMLEDVEKLSNFQLKEMLKSCAWREVRASWKQEMSEKPKLEVLRMIVDKDCKGRSAQIESKEVRRMVTKLRGGTAQLRIETGRWKGEGREERKCKECSGQEVEDAKHFLLKCARWQDEREELIERVKGTQRGGEFEAADDDEKLAMILDGACKERGVEMAIRKMWKKRFV